MTILKNLLVSLLSFLLFLSLTVFGIAFSINSTLLNPDFVSRTIDKIDVAEIIDATMNSQQTGIQTQSEAYDYTMEYLPKIEPVIKEGLSTAVHSTYDYLLGKRDDPELNTVLRDSFLNENFTAKLMAQVDLAPALDEFAAGQTGPNELPPEVTGALIEVAKEFEPELKQRIAAASDDVFAYLTTKTDYLDLAYTLRTEVLTSDIALPLVERLSGLALESGVIEEALVGEIPAEMGFISDYIDYISPQIPGLISEQLSANVDDMLDYLLGQSDTLEVIIDLAPVKGLIEETLPEYLADIPPETLTPFLRSIITDQLTALLPDYLSPYIDEAVTDEWLNQQVAANYDSFISYLTGETSGFTGSIDMEPVYVMLKDAYKDDFLKSPPPEFSGLPKPLLEAAYDTFAASTINSLPSTLAVDESMLGPDFTSQVESITTDIGNLLPDTLDVGDIVKNAVPVDTITSALNDAEISLADVRTEIQKAIGEAEQPLRDARGYISLFQMYYTWLIVLMVVLTAGIILLLRDVRKITRTLGVPLLFYGAFEFAGIWVAKSFGFGQLGNAGFHPVLETLITEVASDAVRPVEILSLSLLAVGVVLVIVSFFYRRGEEA